MLLEMSKDFKHPVKGREEKRYNELMLINILELEKV
jgi:hypothetical protein